MTIIFSSQPFYGQYVQGSTPNNPVSPRICDNSKLWPFFQGCLGAIDGSHIPLSPPTALSYCPPKSLSESKGLSFTELSFHM